MKAPLFIWRWRNEDWPIVHYSDPVSGGLNFDVKAHPAAVKYLRSDLTCSECSKKRSVMYEPMYCEVHTMVNDDDPACMQFSPSNHLLGGNGFPQSGP